MSDSPFMPKNTPKKQRSTAENSTYYTLSPDGAIRHWLACGPITSPLPELAEVVPADGPPFGSGHRWVINYWAFDPESAALKKRVYERLPPFEWEPGERPALNSEGVAGNPWVYQVAEEDNVIDFSLFNFSPTRMQGWLFASVDVPAPMVIPAELITIGPARLWVNGALATHYAEQFSYVATQRIPVTVAFNAGQNEVYLHGDMLGWREARLALGLRFPTMPPIHVRLALGSIPAKQWQRAEQGLADLQVRQFAFPVLPGRIALDPAATAPFRVEAEVIAPTPDKFAAPTPGFAPLRAKYTLDLVPGGADALPITLELAEAMARTPGENTLALHLRPADGTPLEVRREVWASTNTFSRTPYGTFDSRRLEALEHLAAMPYDVLTSMAAVAQGRAKHISSEVVRVACEFMNSRWDCADFYAVGLLALLNWYGDHPALGDMDRERIADAFWRFKYWIDEPGIDAMCYFTENHQVLFHVTAYLAGQRWPDLVFANTLRSGRQQKERARPRIESWILRRLRGNFSEWDSNAYLTLDAFAMLALVEFADSARLRAMAAALLHKIFFMVACQSFRGAHGSTHGRCYVAGLKSSRFENTSSLGRMGWGMGIFNGETRATGMLALAHRYRVPEVIQKIGADLPPVLTTHVRSREKFRPQFDMKSGEWDVRTITRRTPDYMLSAAIDHRPGEMGIQEHLWQATLSPEAVVFTTYPGNSQEHGNARPNFWAGSARLPRVAMLDKTVICIYRLEPGVGLGFTHAYFPIAMFDEVQISGQWAFARLGNGYLALWSDGELILTETGRHADQELRSSGAGEVWLCHVGSAAEDGDFVSFCRHVSQHQPRSGGLFMHWTDPAGRALVFGWGGALYVDGQPTTWDDFPHYENAYTHTLMDAERMLIRHAGLSLGLDLTLGMAHFGV
jgi:hypothetical protein